MAIAVQTDMATPSLHRYGTDELKKEYLDPAVGGETVAAIAVTEPDAGSDVAGMKTKAVRDGDEWVINGTKLFITNGTQADWICLSAGPTTKAATGASPRSWSPPTHPGSRSAGRWRSSARAPRTPPSCASATCGSRSPTPSGRRAGGSSSRWSSSSTERMIASLSGSGLNGPGPRADLGVPQQRQAFGSRSSTTSTSVTSWPELAAEVDLLRHYNRRHRRGLRAGQDTKRMVAIAKLTAGRLLRRVAGPVSPAPRRHRLHGGVWIARYLRDRRPWSIGAGTDEVMLRTIARLDATGA